MGAMRQTAKLLETLEESPLMEGAPTDLEGCLNRLLLHFCRADIWHAMDNMKKAVKEETAALKLNPNPSLTRASRAEVFCAMNWKEEEQRFKSASGLLTNHTLTPDILLACMVGCPCSFLEILRSARALTHAR
jgi:hypothetical protein